MIVISWPRRAPPCGRCASWPPSLYLAWTGMGIGTNGLPHQETSVPWQHEQQLGQASRRSHLLPLCHPPNLRHLHSCTRTQKFHSQIFSGDIIIAESHGFWKILHAGKTNHPSRCKFITTWLVKSGSSWLHFYLEIPVRLQFAVAPPFYIELFTN